MKEALAFIATDQSGLVVVIVVVVVAVVVGYKLCVGKTVWKTR